MKEIPLTQGQFAIVDEQDYELLSSFKWHADFDKKLGSFYAVRSVKKSGKKTKIYMHRFIMNPSYLQVVDRRNHNTLDNTRSNLRLTNKSGNQRNAKIRIDNKSGFAGVYFDKTANKWRANIRNFEKRIHLGYFNSIEDAVAARLNAEKRMGFISNESLVTL